MACTGTKCNQGRAGCDPRCENRKPRSCNELGVCQHRTPPCDEACHPIVNVTANSDHTSPHGEPWDWVDALAIRTRWVAVGASIVCLALAAGLTAVKYLST